MDINYELYKVFYYVASSLSFSDASKKLFISQSAVSQSIKTLERKLGQPLFIRSTKKVQLTPAGALLLKHVEPAMNLISRGESQLLESGSLGLGQLHIGASDTICRYFLLPYLQKFHRKFPDVPIKITNASSMGCVDLLEQRRVDLIITNFPNPHLNPSYIQKTVGSFSDVFVANLAYFDLADRIVPFSELGTYPLMMLDRKSTTSEFLHHIFLQHQLELLPQVELSSNDLLIDMARIGLGIAFIPDFCLKHKPEYECEESILSAAGFVKPYPSGFCLHRRVFKAPPGRLTRTGSLLPAAAADHRRFSFPILSEKALRIRAAGNVHPAEGSRRDPRWSGSRALLPAGLCSFPDSGTYSQIRTIPAHHNNSLKFHVHR